MKPRLRPPLGQRLQRSLEEAISHARGETTLKTTTVYVPDPPPAFDSVRIALLRSRLSMTQLQFARVLNVSKKTIESWEQGLRAPSGHALRLLQVIETPAAVTELVSPRDRLSAASRKG